uniref:Uncharacterized protein n=1 Tax=Anguilla anguilla TaxID=7936 RepID=A0A0E9P832_ANGAN
MLTCTFLSMKNVD